MNRPSGVAIVGVIAIGLGVLSVQGHWIPPVTVDNIAIGVLGAFALLLTWGAIGQYRRDVHPEYDDEAVESLWHTPAPGDHFGDAIRLFLHSPRLHFQRRRIREALRQATVEVLTRYKGYDSETAEQVIETGTWTDNPAASTFLSGDVADGPTFRSKLRGAFRREPRFYLELRNTIRELATIADIQHAVTLPVHDLLQHDEEDDLIMQNDVPETAECHTERDTGHWYGISAVAFIGIGTGLLIEEPAVVLAGVGGIGFLAYAKAGLCNPGQVVIERHIDTVDPAPGTEVTVTVTVRNTGNRLLPDVRIIDGVPAALAVTEGSPRYGTALRPQQSQTFSYTVVARRGVHTFGPVHVTTRDIASTVEQEWSIPEQSTLQSIPSLTPLTCPFPLRDRATQFVGSEQTDIGGTGIEFFATREYRSNDSLRRIDWNRRAKTGQLTTVEFRQERSASVVLLIDARPVAYRSPEPELPHAIDRSVEAAGRMFARLLADGNHVGIAAMGDEDCWLSPGTGVDHHLNAQELLATHPALSAGRPRREPLLHRWKRSFRERLPVGAQLIIVSPLSDTYVEEFAQRFDVYGYPVTIVSIDATSNHTTGHLLAALSRKLQIARLRGVGIPVISWEWDEPVDLGVARTTQQWSK